MFLNVSAIQSSFLISGSDASAGPAYDVARARVRRADVAVEDRPERVVAVQVDAPQSPRGRVAVRIRQVRRRVDTRRPEVRGVRIVRRLPAVDAVVRHVAPLLPEVVHRVVRAVRVRRRQDEDVERVDELLRRVVGAVVPQQLLRGLEARQRRRPLAGVLLAVEEDADLLAVALLPDSQYRVLERSALHVRVRHVSVCVHCREEVGQVDLRPRLRDPGPCVAAVGERHHERRGLARVDRGHDLRGSARERARGVRPQPDGDVLTADVHCERRAGHARVHELGGDVVPALVAPRA